MEISALTGASLGTATSLGFAVQGKASRSAEAPAVPAAVIRPSSATAPSVAMPSELTLSEDARAEQDRETQLRSVIERHMTIDPATRQVVYQVRDTLTDAIVFQLPDERTLRARAYYYEQSHQAAAPLVDHTS